MAGSTRRSLAGTAAAAAKKVMSRRPSKATSAEAESAPEKVEAPAKKATVKKAPAKKTAATTAPTTSSAAKKTAAKKAPAKKAPAKKAPAKKAPAKKTTRTPAAAVTQEHQASTTATQSPAKKSPATKSATKKATVKPTAKKTAAKKTATPKARADRATSTGRGDLAVREDESAWTKVELDEVLTELNEHAVRLREELREQEDELADLMRDAGDGAGHDQADLGATSFERDQEIIVVNNARDVLAQIERALGRIEDGSYGVCESCGKPVGKMRLMAFPRATMCLPCKQREERR